MSAPKNAVNGYYCPDCHKTTVVRHADAGVTPMFLACRQTKACDGMAQSLGYPKGPPPHPPTHEWYKPTRLELTQMSPEMQHHVKRGGLALREATGPVSPAAAQPHYETVEEIVERNLRVRP